MPHRDCGRLQHVRCPKSMEQIAHKGRVVTLAVLYAAVHPRKTLAKPKIESGVRYFQVARMAYIGKLNAARWCPALATHLCVDCALITYLLTTCLQTSARSISLS
jgi:hypothetical protein